jgi:hypothetical protein
MAKAKDLVALAGLAGLAYAMRNKDKYNEDAGNQEKSSYTGADTRTKGVEEGPRRQITDYMAKAPLDGTEMYPSYVMGGASQPISTPRAPVLTKTPPVSDRRDLESGMSRGTRPMDPRNIEAGMSRGTRPMDPRDLEAGMSRGTRYKQPMLMKKGGSVKKMASGGMTSSASKRADGIATKGKTRVKMV